MEKEKVCASVSEDAVRACVRLSREQVLRDACEKCRCREKKVLTKEIFPSLLFLPPNLLSCTSDYEMDALGCEEKNHSMSEAGIAFHFYQTRKIVFTIFCLDE